MSANFLKDERLSDLMVRRAVGALDPVGRAELDERARRYSDYDDDAVDRIAAALSIKGLEMEPMPEPVRERLATSADRSSLASPT